MPGCLHGHADSESCRVTGDELAGHSWWQRQGSNLHGLSSAGSWCSALPCPGQGNGPVEKMWCHRAVHAARILRQAPGRPRAPSNVRVLRDARVARPVHLLLREVLQGEDGGNILGGQAVEVEVNLWPPESLGVAALRAILRVATSGLSRAYL